MTTQISGTTGVTTPALDLTTPLPIAEGGTGVSSSPAFSAYASVATTIAHNSPTKILFQTEEFDTTNAYDSVTNSRFQPTIAGYYHVNSNVVVTTAAASLYTSIFKNGVELRRGTQFSLSSNNAFGAPVSSVVFLNGSTDYIEIYVYQATTGSTVLTTIVSSITYFQAYLARAS